MTYMDDLPSVLEALVEEVKGDVILTERDLKLAVDCTLDDIGSMDHEPSIGYVGFIFAGWCGSIINDQVDDWLSSPDCRSGTIQEAVAEHPLCHRHEAPRNDINIHSYLRDAQTHELVMALTKEESEWHHEFMITSGGYKKLSELS